MVEKTNLSEVLDSLRLWIPVLQVERIAKVSSAPKSTRDGKKMTAFFSDVISQV